MRWNWSRTLRTILTLFSRIRRCRGRRTGTPCAPAASTRNWNAYGISIWALPNAARTSPLRREDKLNDFAKAVPWHVALSVMRDLRTGLYMVPAGTYGYGACGNEASLQIRMLDMLGYHDEAEKYLETFVVSQGAGSMDGNFTSNSGALVANNYGGYSDNITSSFAYNLDHGYILNCFIDHYRLTGDPPRLAGTYSGNARQSLRLYLRRAQGHHAAG